MLVLIDVDGVLCDLTSYICDWLCVRYDGVKRTPEDHRQWDYADSFGVPRATIDRFWAEVGVARHAERLPAYPGARRFVDTLRRKHRVVACTASAGAEWTGQRAMWLSTVMGFNHNDVVICPADLKGELRAGALIDDRISTCEAFGTHGLALLFDRPWNQGAESSQVRRVHSYDAILSEFGC